MYIISELAKAIQEEKLDTARRQLRGGIYAAGHAGTRTSRPRRLVNLRVVHARREHRAAQAY